MDTRRSPCTAGALASAARRRRTRRLLPHQLGVQIARDAASFSRSTPRWSAATSRRYAAATDVGVWTPTSQGQCAPRGDRGSSISRTRAPRRGTAMRAGRAGDEASARAEAPAKSSLGVEARARTTSGSLVKVARLGDLATLESSIAPLSNNRETWPLMSEARLMSLELKGCISRWRPATARVAACAPRRARRRGAEALRVSMIAAACRPERGIAHRAVGASVRARRRARAS